MVSKSVFGAALSAAVLTAGAGTASANLLTNGSFEDGLFVGLNWFMTYTGGSTDIDGWVVTGNSIDYVHSRFWQPSEGSLSIDLTGTPGVGGISQTFATTIGVQYVVDFDLSGNPDGGDLIKEVLVSAAGQFANYTFDTTGHTRSSMGWEARTFVFTATSTSTTLEFASLSSTGDYFGPAIDNVSVEIVPSPASLAILALGTACGLRRRR